jgi:RHS repeat-associated protein
MAVVAAQTDWMHVLLRRIAVDGFVSKMLGLNGDLSAKTVGADTTFYDFNSLSLLRFVRFQNGTTLRYAYDSQGRRTFQIVNDIAKQKFIYNFNDQIVAVVDENAKLTQFVYSTLSHSPDYMIQDGVKYRFIHDQIGSVRFVVNTSTNAVVQTVTYDEFGNVLTDSNPSLQPFRFAGCLYDTYTKLCRFGARDYDPETGRWTSKDPIMFAGGDTNLYGYVMQDPINFIDPTGPSQADVGRIRAGFNEIVEQMNRYGDRRPGSGVMNGILNNFSGFADRYTGGRLGSPYLGCADQSENTIDHLRTLDGLDDNWTYSLKFNLPFHFTLEGRSSNPSDPVLNIDPWRNHMGQ